MAPKARLEPSTHHLVAVGIPLIAIGIVSAVVVAGLLDGFVRGLALGAGGTLIAIGAYVLSPVVRRTLSQGDGGDGVDGDSSTESWLPSRDHDQ